MDNMAKSESFAIAQHGPVAFFQIRQMQVDCEGFFLRAKPIKSYGETVQQLLYCKSSLQGIILATTEPARLSHV
jgi:hypothetical protein